MIKVSCKAKKKSILRKRVIISVAAAKQRVLKTENFWLGLGFPGVSDSEESACNVGYLGSVPGLGRTPGEGKGYPLQYFGLENSTDCIVHVVTESRHD